MGDLIARGMANSALSLSTFPKNTIALLGDSITNMNGVGDDAISFGVANNYVLSSFGYFTWANVLLGQRLKMVKNAGIGGNTTTQMLARIKTDVLDYKAGYCIVLGGTNDVELSTDIELIKSNLLSIYTLNINNGSIVIAGTVPPNSIASAATKKRIAVLNNYIRSLRSVLKNFIVCDWYEDIADPSNGNWKTSLGASDGRHPSVQGAYKMGYKLFTVLQYVVPVASIFSGSNINDDSNPFVNPYLLGGATIAPNWISYAPSATLTESKVSRGNGLEWQQESNSAAAAAMNLYQIPSSGFTIGQKVSAYVEFEIDAGATAIDNYLCLLATQDASSTTIVSSYSLSMSGGTDSTIRFGQDKVAGVLYMPRFTIPALTTKLVLQFTSKQVGAFRVGRTRVILE